MFKVGAAFLGTPPAGWAWWTATWYSPPLQVNSGFIALTQLVTFNVPAGPGYLYVDGYDGGYNILTDLQPRGYITPAEGSTWSYNFSTGVLTQTVAPPGGGISLATVGIIGGLVVLGVVVIKRRR